MHLPLYHETTVAHCVEQYTCTTNLVPYLCSEWEMSQRKKGNLRAVRTLTARWPAGTTT